MKNRKLKNTIPKENKKDFDFVFKDIENNFIIDKTKKGGSKQTTVKIINTHIYDGTVIAGRCTVDNCTINDYVTIQDNAYVKNSALNDYSIVKDNAIIKKCLLFDNIKIYNNAILKDGVWCHGDIKIGGNVKITGCIILTGNATLEGDIVINPKLLNKYKIPKKGGYFILKFRDLNITNQDQFNKFLINFKKEKE